VSCGSATQGCPPPRAVGPSWAGWAPPPQRRAAQQRGGGIAIRAVANEDLTLGAPSQGEPQWGRLTLTSQMLMPPSIPVVQNCEQLAFPPASTEIWLWGAKRRRGVSPRPPPSPRGCPGVGRWERGQTPPSPVCRNVKGCPRMASDAPGIPRNVQGYPRMPRDALGIPRKACGYPEKLQECPGLSQLLGLDLSISPTHVRGMLQGCSGIPGDAPSLSHLLGLDFSISPNLV